MSATGKLTLIAAVLFLTAGCATQSGTRYGNDGIYYEQAPRWSVAAYSASYPYWSLDHFYFSRYYSPYSVVVGYWDPWGFPYSAWYWGYPYGFGYASSIHRPWGYGGYWGYWGPWRNDYYYSNRHHNRPHYQPRSIDYRGRRMANGIPVPPTQAGHRSSRLQRFESQQQRRGGDGFGATRPAPIGQSNRRAGPSAGSVPIQRRAPAPVSRPSRGPSRAPERVRESPP